ncbi:Lysine histidine transporter-like 5 [Linum grandiflorum]
MAAADTVEAAADTVVAVADTAAVVADKVATVADTVEAVADTVEAPVWKKLVRNPNIHASFLGIVWSLVSFRWDLKLPAPVQNSVTIISNTGLGMVMFSLEVAQEQEMSMRTAAKEEDLNKWLPITASREAKWWYSAFHNVTAMVGAGVLGLPFAMSQLGWTAGLIAIVMSWLITLYSLWLLVEMHELVPGRRFDRYHELGQHAFGEKRGYWIVFPQQLLVQVASDIVYMVTGGKSLKKFFELTVPEIGDLRQTYFILAFFIIQLIISQTPNFNSLKIVSLLAAIMSGTYSMIAFVASTIKGANDVHTPSYELRAHTTTGVTFEVLNALGTVAFAFAGHSVVLEIQATIPSTPEKPSKKPMWKGVILAYVIVMLCYVSVAASGYWAFGNGVEDDVLVSLQHPNWLIAVANLMVFVHVVGSYQLPCIIWLRLKRPAVGSWHWIASWVSIIVGVAVAILAPIGGFRQILLSAKTYSFFS